MFCTEEIPGTITFFIDTTCVTYIILFLEPIFCNKPNVSMSYVPGDIESSILMIELDGNSLEIDKNISSLLL